MPNHYDQLESRDPEQRERALFNMLPGFIERAINLAPGWAAHLDGIESSSLDTRETLSKLPLIRKSALKDLQFNSPPFGGFATSEAGVLGRLFMSPGPIFEPEGRGEDWWRSARGFYAAGFRAGDIVHNTFAYHLTPGAWIVDAGARAIGCTVIPAGPGNTEQQLEAIAHLRPTAYCGVPDYLKILLDRAVDAGKDTSSIKRALVSGGPLFPSLRQEYLDRDLKVFQFYGTAEAGNIAYESEALEGMIVDEGVILEIVQPGTGNPIPDGEVGEVVVTTFNRDYPMIRLATGDLSAILPGQSPCGRTNTRIKGWMGRADQTTKVKGMFVHPEQVVNVAQRHPELARVRLVVAREGEQDMMVLKAESVNHDAGLVESVAQTLQELTKLKGAVQLVPPETLPNDGKIIADERDFGS
ncbi:MAG: phenylacetate--CoA ligase family protein [Hyphomicrobiaceae bacterium]